MLRDDDGVINGVRQILGATSDRLFQGSALLRFFDDLDLVIVGENELVLVGCFVENVLLHFGIFLLGVIVFVFDVFFIIVTMGRFLIFHLRSKTDHGEDNFLLGFGELSHGLVEHLLEGFFVAFALSVFMFDNIVFLIFVHVFRIFLLFCGFRVFLMHKLQTVFVGAIDDSLCLFRVLIAMRKSKVDKSAGIGTC